jgi:hypothetical protein
VCELGKVLLVAARGSTGPATVRVLRRLSDAMARANEHTARVTRRSGILIAVYDRNRALLRA